MVFIVLGLIGFDLLTLTRVGLFAFSITDFDFCISSGLGELINKGVSLKTFVRRIESWCLLSVITGLSCNVMVVPGFFMIVSSLFSITFSPGLVLLNHFSGRTSHQPAPSKAIMSKPAGTQPRNQT